MPLAKVIEVVSTSQQSFDDAFKQGVKEAAQSVRGISGVKVTDWTANVENDQLTSYKVTMNIAFSIEGK